MTTGQIHHPIRMSAQPLDVGTRYLGDSLQNHTIHGLPFEITGPATRKDFVAQFAPGEMTGETARYLEEHPELHFYRVEPVPGLTELVKLILES